ncbi:hypothetical protein ACHAXS_010848, partial [Conticribra weissflogii]
SVIGLKKRQFEFQIQEIEFSTFRNKFYQLIQNCLSGTNTVRGIFENVHRHILQINSYHINIFEMSQFRSFSKDPE